MNMSAAASPSRTSAVFGIENFDAVINPPHGAILAVGAGVKKPVVAPMANLQSRPSCRSRSRSITGSSTVLSARNCCRRLLTIWNRPCSCLRKQGTAVSRGEWRRDKTGRAMRGPVAFSGLRFDLRKPHGPRAPYAGRGQPPRKGPPDGLERHAAPHRRDPRPHAQGRGRDRAGLSRASRPALADRRPVDKAQGTDRARHRGVKQCNRLHRLSRQGRDPAGATRQEVAETINVSC